MTVSIASIGQQGAVPGPRSVRIRAYSRFERLIGGSWIKVDADFLSVNCTAPGAADGDQEHDAGFTDVKFWTGFVGFGLGIPVQCNHQANFGALQFNETTGGLF